jgi:hypothetical protein
VVAEVNYFPDIAGGDPMSVSINYQNGVFNAFIEDTLDPSVTLSLSTNVNIPFILETNMAYVGFTGADGGVASIQTVTAFTYIPLPNLTATVSGGNLILSWPTGTGAYQLESSTNLANANGWVNVTTQPTVVNGQNQVTVPLAAGSKFYRLQLQ